jgi:hypothetical protein
MTCGHMLHDIRIYDGEYSKAKADVLSQGLEVYVTRSGNGARGFSKDENGGPLFGWRRSPSASTSSSSWRWRRWQSYAGTTRSRQLDAEVVRQVALSSILHRATRPWGPWLP